MAADMKDEKTKVLPGVQPAGDFTVTMTEVQRSMILLALNNQMAVMKRSLGKEIPGGAVHQARMAEINAYRVLMERF